MLHHVELYVRDLERSIAFWTPFMGLLGYEEERWSTGVNYLLGEEDPYVCLVQASAEHLAAGYHRRRVGLNHLAFRARSRAHGDEVRAWARAAGHPLPAHLVKARWLYGLDGFPGDIRPEEVVLQTFTVPLAAFEGAPFEAADLTAIRFAFAGNEGGAVYLDEVALTGE